MINKTSQPFSRNAVQKYLNERLFPISDQFNEEGTFPKTVYQEYFKLGFGASFMPEEWGGDGDLVTYLRYAEEMGRIDAGFALSVLASAILFGNNVLLNGSDAQKRKYIPGIVDGSKIGCWALTEPSGGSDAVSIKSTAEKKEKNGEKVYVLNGSKTFITNAPVADYFIILTRLKGTEKDGIKGGCAFIVEKGTPGLSVGKPLKKMGHKTSPTGEIFLDNCEVPESALLGIEGQAFLDMKKSLDFERMTFAGIGIGMIDELLKIMIRYAAGRNQFGKPILEYQLIQEKIAVIGAEFETLKAYCENVHAKFLTQASPITEEAAIIKYLLSKLLVRAADEAIQILGGYGYMTEYRVERFYRDAKLYEIGGGTSEIQKLIIAKTLTKKYLRSDAPI